MRTFKQVVAWVVLLLQNPDLTLKELVTPGVLKSTPNRAL